MAGEDNYSQELWNISTRCGDISRYSSVEVALYGEYGPEFFDKYELSLGVALQIIEYLKAAETVFQRLASLDDIAAVSGQKKATHSTNVGKLVKKQILSRYRSDGKLYFVPHPRFFECAEVNAVDAQSSVEGVHSLPLDASVSTESDSNANNSVAQDLISGDSVSMKAIIEYYRAVRDEIWHRERHNKSKRSRTVVLNHVLQIHLVTGERNDWVRLTALVEDADAAMPWASRLTTEMQERGYLEKESRVAEGGTLMPFQVIRFVPEFWEAVQVRYSSYLASPTATPPSAPSSNAQSTSDNPLP